MMIQLEGPIVDSIYDMALISWHKNLEPPLPCLTNHEESREDQHVKFARHERTPENGNHQVDRNALGEYDKISQMYTTKSQQPDIPQATNKSINPVGNENKGSDSKTGTLFSRFIPNQILNLDSTVLVYQK